MHETSDGPRIGSSPLRAASRVPSAAVDEAPKQGALVVFYDTTLSAEEGLWSRTGWAGRS